VGQIAISFTVCVDERRRAFLNPADVEQHIRLMEEQFARFGCRVPIYCFMPDHLHVMSMGMTYRADGKRAMDAFKTKSGQYLQSVGANYRWQENYHDRIIRHSNEWRKKVFYIFQNPVRAEIVEEPRAYLLTGSIGYDLEELIHEAAW
jgi:REP element-mobilizing transposase RayT